MGQVIRATVSGSWPWPASWARNRVHLALEPISPMLPSLTLAAREQVSS